MYEYEIVVIGEWEGGAAVWRYALHPTTEGVPTPLNHGWPMAGPEDAALAIARLLVAALTASAVNVDPEPEVRFQPLQDDGGLEGLADRIVGAAAVATGAPEGEASLALVRTLLRRIREDPDPRLAAMGSAVLAAVTVPLVHLHAARYTPTAEA